MRNIQGLPLADPSSDSLGRLNGQCPGLFYVACGINVRVVFVPTGHADKHRLRPAASRIHNAAFGACLRSVCGIAPRKLAAAFCELVIKHVRKHAPALSRILRFKPAFALTFRPGSSTVPFALADYSARAVSRP
jgi:hypothetical protein